MFFKLSFPCNDSFFVLKEFVCVLSALLASVRVRLPSLTGSKLTQVCSDNLIIRCRLKIFFQQPAFDSSSFVVGKNRVSKVISFTR